MFVPLTHGWHRRVHEPETTELISHNINASHCFYYTRYNNNTYIMWTLSYSLGPYPIIIRSDVLMTSLITRNWFISLKIKYWYCFFFSRCFRFICNNTKGDNIIILVIKYLLLKQELRMVCSNLFNDNFMA